MIKSLQGEYSAEQLHLDVFTAAVIGMEQVGSSKELIGPFWKSIIIAGLLAGEVYVAETLDSHKVCGCAAWYAPGCSLFDRYFASVVLDINVYLTMLLAKKNNGCRYCRLWSYLARRYPIGGRRR